MCGGGHCSVNAAKQLAEETCQFASSISGAIKLNHKVSAYANLRPLLDRFLHAARFFEEPMDTVTWSYWSMAEINRLVNNALSQGAVNPQDREPMRELLRVVRHWNRSESGQDRQMSKPSRYEWNRILRELVNDANPRLEGAYDITSTYVHPTYRGPNTPDLGTKYVLEQAIWITSATLIVCGAALMPHEDGPTANQANPHLLEVLEMLRSFLGGNVDFVGAAKNPPEGVSSAQMLYLYGSMLVEFAFGRDVIKGQPRIR